MIQTPHPAIELRRATKKYPGPQGEFAALCEVNLRIERGEYVTIVGASGSGKSTLLNLMAGIDRATSGEVVVAGTSLQGLSERSLSAWRGRELGIVFQFFQLMPTLTAVENVMLPMDLCNRWPAIERRERARALLARLGVEDQADKFPAALSGGQQQRVAVARALANAPSLLLADEPTGNLDSRNADALMQMLAALARSDGVTVVVVTHERNVHTDATRTITLADGAIVPEGAHV